MTIECIYLGEEGMISGNRKCLHPMIHAGDPGVPEAFCRKCSYRQATGERLPLSPLRGERCPHLYRRARDQEGKIKKRLCKFG